MFFTVKNSHTYQRLSFQFKNQKFMGTYRHSELKVQILIISLKKLRNRSIVYEHYIMYSSGLPLMQLLFH